ncbi:MAG: hypothetical protein NWE87_05815 [Candidatus Bathyarchaeota archaeon]|nr:hypothetical protein [Candidatus Bathyarchaeota archaeon]
MKKVIIVVTLVEECNDMPNHSIEEEIRKELSEHLPVIPWAKEVQSVAIK